MREVALNQMTHHLSEFAKYVRDAATDKQAERVVRLMIEKVAKNCPLDVLVQIGQCIVECRKDELRNNGQ